MGVGKQKISAWEAHIREDNKARPEVDATNGRRMTYSNSNGPSNRHRKSTQTASPIAEAQP